MSTLGKITGEAIAAYHAQPAISHSKLEVFRRRPALYKKRFVDGALPREESAASTLGSALHCAVLETKEYDKRFAVRPDGLDRRTKEGKAQWESFLWKNEGKTILDAEQSRTVDSMVAAIAGNVTAAALLAEGEPEVTWRAKLAALPHPAQCRTDWFNANGCELSEGRPYVADVKTVETLDAAEFRNFERAFVGYGYHRQCGFYLPLLQDCGVKIWDFFFIVVEKCEPFGCIVYRPTEDAIACGVDETAHDLSELARCYTRGLWPNMPTGVHDIGLPSWYRKDSQ